MKIIARRSLFCISLTAALLWIACDGDSPTGPDDGVSNTDFVAEESFSFERTVANQTSLRVQGINGAVTVTGSSEANSVTITGVRRVGSDSLADAQARLPDLQVRVTDQANEILVETIQPQNTEGRNYAVDYTITVPRGFDVSVTNVNGNVDLRQISGSATIDLTNGPIDGEVTLPRDGTIDMATVNGNINLRIPQDTNAEFSANVTNGTISVSGLDLQGQASTNTSLQGTLGDGRGTISLRTTNGDISVTGF